MVFLGVPGWGVALTFVLSAIIGVLFSCDRLSRGAIARNLNSIAVLISAVGILGIFVESRGQLAGLSASRVAGAYLGSGEFVNDRLSFHRLYFCETLFRKTEDAPIYFDDAIFEQKQLCNWLKSISTAIKNEEIDMSIKLIDQLPNPPILVTPSWKPELLRLNDAIALHDLEEITSLRHLEQPSWWLRLQMFLPLILALSLGFQVGYSRKI